MVQPRKIGFSPLFVLRFFGFFPFPLSCFLSSLLLHPLSFFSIYVERVLTWYVYTPILSSFCRLLIFSHPFLRRIKAVKTNQQTLRSLIGLDLTIYLTDSSSPCPATTIKAAIPHRVLPLRREYILFYMFISGSAVAMG